MFIKDFKKDKSYDVIIAGAGAAGITLAIELMNTDKSVLLLEAGTFDFSKDSQEYYSGIWNNKVRNESTEVAGRTKSDRLRQWGGTTNHWAGRVRRFDPIDFEKRSFVAESGWPIGYNDLEPHYKRAEEILDITDGNHISSQKGDAIDLNYFSFSKPTRMGEKYYDTLNTAKNIDVLLSATLVDIDFSSVQKEVVKVNVTIGSESNIEVSGKKFVMCLGGLECNRLMLNLALKNNFPFQKVIGKYFMGHAIYAPSVVFLNEKSDHDKFLNNYESPFYEMGNPINKFITKIGLKTGVEIPKLPLNEQKQAQMFFQLSEKAQKRHEVLNIGFTLNGTHSPSAQEVNFLAQPKFHWLKRFKAYQLLSRGEQSPNVNSHVTIGSEKNKDGLYQVKVNWNYSEEDEKNTFEANKILNQFLIDNQLGLIKDNITTQNLPTGMWTGAHHLGGLRMGENVETSVVDKNCKMHGSDNVYILSSAIFPTSGLANPTLTVTALASRLGKLLKQ